MTKKLYLAGLLILFLGLYSYIYFHLTYFVFFNYDMPRVALVVQDFLKTGTYLTSQKYFEESVWRNIPWGPALIFFYAAFLKISNDPLIVSYFLSALNLMPIFMLVLFVWRHFSKSAAIISGFLLAFNPYWITYARIIYNPSPLTFFLPISLFLFFEGVYFKKWWGLLLLPISWVALIQSYIPAYSFIFTSVILLLFNLKKSDIKYLILGGIASFILLTPTLVFLKDNPQYLNRYTAAPSLFTPPEKSFNERFTKVLFAYFQIPVGGRFDIPMGYGFNDFVSRNISIEPFMTATLSTLFIFALVWNFYKAVFKRDSKRLALFFFAIAPLWSMMVLWVSEILPRYFLVGFPTAMILIALFLYDLTKVTKLFYILPIGIILYWFSFSYLYNNFIKNYDYPHGRLGESAETPYIFLRDAVRYVTIDAASKKCSPVITNNPENPNFDMWLETKYVWKYIFYKDTNLPTDDKNNCYYVVNFRDQPKKFGVTNYEVFGQYAVFNLDSRSLQN